MANTAGIVLSDVIAAGTKDDSFFNRKQRISQ
jgi:hypothetical protein